MTRDVTSVVADRLSVAHPYLLAGVGVYARERICDLEEALSEACHEIWLSEAAGEGSESHPPNPTKVGSRYGEETLLRRGVPS